MSDTIEKGDGMHEMIKDVFRVESLDGGNESANVDENESVNEDDGCVNFDDINEGNDSDGPNEEAIKFFTLLKDAETEIYPGVSKCSKLNFVVRLLNLKCLNGWSNKSVDMLLSFLKEIIPNINVPKNYYESKNQLKDLDMDYIKIDACPNDCMLYWKDDNSGKNECDVCEMSRWTKESSNPSSKKKKRKAAKILRYFPIKPRLQRLYMCSKIVKEMRWHNDECKNDGFMRHPADTPAWKYLDKKYPSFAAEPRNVRLGLATDGFNPYGSMNSVYSTWPVVLVPYNLPPWMCMKQYSFILALLIPGPRGPGNDIDVYLQPLIEELVALWTDGVETFDANLKQKFCMRVVVIWTISDFVGKGDISGWCTKGYLACPCCHAYPGSERLQSKCCFMRLRRNLSRGHKYRKNKSSFNNKVKLDDAPKPLSGEEVLMQLRGHSQIIFGKAGHDKCGMKRKRPGHQLPNNWKKISIFFKLPYWKDNLLRHSLDPMHIEKNNDVSWVATILDWKRNTKDNLKARKDLQEMGIRKELHPIPRMDGKFYLPLACYTMSKLEKKKFCEYLRNIKVPDNYSSNISRRVQMKDFTLPGLKSHDWHVLMQQLLPIAVRGILPKHVTLILVELSTFYRKLCSKVLRVEELEQLESQIALTLCKMEMVFPQAFFDVMTHLPIHLAGEAKVAGPVNYRWMYPIERSVYTSNSNGNCSFH